jgi:hypothetical protein
MQEMVAGVQSVTRDLWPQLEDILDFVIRACACGQRPSAFSGTQSAGSCAVISGTITIADTNNDEIRAVSPASPYDITDRGGTGVMEALKPREAWSHELRCDLFVRNLSCRLWSPPDRHRTERRTARLSSKPFGVGRLVVGRRDAASRGPFTAEAASNLSSGSDSSPTLSWGLT